jgi:hypothetical protein
MDSQLRYSLVAENMKCVGPQLRAASPKQHHTVDGCAHTCRQEFPEGLWFIYGNNDYSEAARDDRCGTGTPGQGPDGCSCYCDSAPNSDECTQQGRLGYSLYKYTCMCRYTMASDYKATQSLSAHPPTTYIASFPSPTTEPLTVVARQTR